jgi:hypothetical protein
MWDSPSPEEAAPSFETPRCARLLKMRAEGTHAVWRPSAPLRESLILRSPPKAGVSKDEAEDMTPARRRVSTA